MPPVVSALHPSGSASRAALRLVTRVEAARPAVGPLTPIVDDLPGREREKRLVERSRDAHFAVRVRFRELVTEVAGSGLEFLYDQARRVDGELASLYQARAAVLAHRLQRATASADAPSQPLPAAPPGEPQRTADLTIEERALVLRLRSASEQDRRALLHLAVRFAETSRTGR